MSIKIDQLIRSKRQTLSLEIQYNGKLIVRSPFSFSIKKIEKILQEKEDWVIKKQDEIKKKIIFNQPKQFIIGEKFLYLGKYYKLYIANNQKATLEISSYEEDNNQKKMIENFATGLTPLLQNQDFFLSTNHNSLNKFPINGQFLIKEEYSKKAKDIEKALSNWYKRKAINLFVSRVKNYADKHNLKFNKIRISSAKSRWGSCNSIGNLSFCWRLIMAPFEILDYVVVHEVCHLIEHNHSRKYWDNVESIIPNCKIYRKWLKENGYLLDW